MGKEFQNLSHDEEGRPIKDISHIIQTTKSRALFEAERIAAGMTIVASHNPPCLGHEGRLSGEKIAHPIVVDFSDGTREVSCPYIDGRGDMELTTCGSEAKYNCCIYLRHDNIVLR